MIGFDLVNDQKWSEFLDYKLSKEFVPKKEKTLLKDFIENKKYNDICKKIANESYTFSNPKKHLISKGHSGKKRIVYTYNDDEMIILKFISYLLYEYDYFFMPNLYSFRKNSSVKNAIRNISNIKNIQNMYGYKVDIHNYFNSINEEILLSNLKKDIHDIKLFNLFESLLLNKNVEYYGKIIEEKKGVMAGTPISAFLANYYIKEIDEFFWNKKVVYARYADDIILFCSSEEELYSYQKELLNYFKKYDLEINPEKEYFFKPQEKWEFLGFSFDGKKIDLSQNSVRKIKAKIRRSARGIRRWMLKKDADYMIALKAMNRKYNRKFFGKQDKEELSWKYWFFPTINTVESLKIIDKYMQEEQRYIVTGKHNKRNYKIVPYDTLKKCNYKSLVNEYYNQLLFNMENKI
jgi:retron-type reverse transcriptase